MTAAKAPMITDGWHVAYGVAANDQHAGAGGDLGFKAQADKGNDDAVVLLEREIGDRAGAVADIQVLVSESCAAASSLIGELCLDCHKVITPHQRSTKNRSPAADSIMRQHL